MATRRRGTAERKTTEAAISVEILLDKPGYQISLSAKERESGIEAPIIRHFWDQLHRFSDIGGKVVGQGNDLPHHVIEDIGIAWGQAFKEALGDKAGIPRTKSHIMPMQGTIVTVAVDLSGRPHATLVFPEMRDDPTIVMLCHILLDIAMHGALDLYVKAEWVGDDAIRDVHHVVETVAKALGVVLKDATRVAGTEVLSVKGKLG